LATQASDALNAHVRLITPLSSSTSKPGFEFSAVVIAPLNRSGRVLMPPGTKVYGTVTGTKAVGLGLARERASIGLEFREYALPDGRRFPLQAQLKSVENGRETITKDGQIQGVLAADSPQQFLAGVWTRPTMAILQRTAVGLTGPSGKIWTSYSMGPMMAAAVYALRCAVFSMPEPDIQLPSGAELSVTVLNVPDNAPDFDQELLVEVPADLTEFLQDQPYVVRQGNGRAVKDIINIAFEGTRDELLNAFRAAGWNRAEPFSTKSLTQEFVAYSEKRGYSEAPMSKLIYNDVKPDFVFQKSLNNIMMRHHVRVWKVKAEGREIWLGAATRDIGFSFDARGVKFSHQIQQHIDWERNKIVDDLSFSGCSEWNGRIDRRDASQQEFDRSGVVTDGGMAVVRLRGCEAGERSTVMDRPAPVGSRATRIARRLILETRQYVERENSIFWTYRLIRWTVAARRNRGASEQEY
jgi:LssY C-terminus